MPNYCTCSLTVRAKTSEDLHTFIDRVKGKDTDLSFDKLVPCPKELIDTDSFFISSLDIKEIEENIQANNIKYSMNLTEEEVKARIERDNKRIEKYKANIEKFGYKDWYDFQVNEWGTKWDVTTNLLEICDSEIEAYYNFETAWTPPTVWLKKIGSMFPNCKFFMTYYELDGGFAGSIFVHKKVCKDTIQYLFDKPKDWSKAIE